MSNATVPADSITDTKPAPVVLCPTNWDVVVGGVKFGHIADHTSLMRPSEDGYFAMVPGWNGHCRTLDEAVAAVIERAG